MRFLLFHPATAFLVACLILLSFLSSPSSVDAASNSKSAKQIRHFRSLSAHSRHSRSHRADATPQQNAVPFGIYTESSLSLHSSDSDCLIAINDAVYQLSGFAQVHPGGAKKIFNLCGTDSTKKFYHKHRNAQSHLEELDRYKIGAYEKIYSAGSLPDVPKVKISPALLQQHQSTNDCWIAINGIVYQFAAYSRQHPGGSSQVTSQCGQDRSQQFAAIPQHSGGLAALAGLAVGQLQGAPPPPPPTPVAQPPPPPPAATVAVQAVPSAPAPAVFTPASIAVHSSSSDCYVAIHNNVYQLDAFAELHPGGASKIHKACGQDASRTFDSHHDDQAGHLAVLAKYKIGTLQSPAATVAVQVVPPVAVVNSVAPSAPAPAVFTPASIAVHSSPSDCYVAIHNNVYQLDAFAERHPGGASKIHNACGQDASHTFDSHHDDPADHLAVLAKYKIGTLPAE